MRVLLIAGLPKSGKTFVGEFLARSCGVRYANTSDVIYEEAARRHGGWVMQAPKEVIRPILIEVGDDLCAGNPAELLERLVRNGNRILCGLRKPLELRTFKTNNPGLEVKSLWIQNSGIISPPDNTLLAAADCDMVIENSIDRPLKPTGDLLHISNWMTC